MSFVALRSFGDTPPPGVTFPTKADYTVALSAAIVEVQGALPQFEAPIIDHVSAVRTTIESTTGVKIEKVAGLVGDVAALSTLADPGSVVAAVTDLVLGGMDIATDVLQTAGVATNAAKAVASVVAVIGGFVQALVGAIFSSQAYWEAKAAERAEVAKEAERVSIDQCRQRLAEQRPTATVPGSPSPGDLFRPLLYALQAGTPLPMSTASIYYLLGTTDSAAWSTIRQQYMAATGRIKIPRFDNIATRKRIRALVVAILNSVEKPEFLGPGERRGDGGAAAMPILQHLIVQEWMSDKTGTGPLLTEDNGVEKLVNLLGRLIAGKHCTVVHWRNKECAANEPCKWKPTSPPELAVGPVPPDWEGYPGYADDRHCCSEFGLGEGIATSFKEQLLPFQSAVRALNKNVGSKIISMPHVPIHRPVAPVPSLVPSISQPVAAVLLVALGYGSFAAAKKALDRRR